MELETLRKSAKMELWTSVPVMFLALAIPTLFWFGFLKGAVDASSWFQRSGSFMILFAVWAEFKLFKLGNNMNPRSEHGQSWDDIGNSDALHKEFGGYVATFKTIAAILAIFGTLICGYGDLVYIYWN
ncbi:hypothetical protein ACSWLQ_002265 [Vibrio fluvialis]